MRTLLLALTVLGLSHAAAAGTPPPAEPPAQSGAQAWHTPDGLRLAVPEGTRVTLLDADEKVLWKGTAGAEPLAIAGELGDPMLRLIRFGDAGPARSLQELFPAVEVTGLLPSAVALGLPLEVLAVTRDRSGAASGFVPGVRGFVQLQCEGKPVWTAELLTDEAGVAQSTEPVPEAVGGPDVRAACELALSLGGATLRQKVKLVSGARLLLSADRPIYRPGDTVYARALTLDRATSRPKGAVAVKLSLKDAGGAVVARATATSSRFGVGSAALALPKGVRGASFTLLAETPDGKTERKLALGQFVKAGLELALQAPAAVPAKQRFSVDVQITRLDGGPGSNAQVELRLGDWQQRATADAQGHLRAELPGLTEDATLAVRAELDGGRMGRAEAAVRVERDDAQLYVVPESGQLVRGLASAAWAVLIGGDGEPIAGAVVKADGAGCETNASGICQLRLQTKGATLGVEAAWGGPSAPRKAHRELRVVEGDSLLSVEHAVLDPGQPLRATYRNARGRDDALVRLELVAEGQVLASATGRLDQGATEFSLAVPPDAKGTLVLQAFRLDAQGKPQAGDARLVLITPPADLQVAVTSDRAVYAPRQTAALRFEVRDGAGHPVAAAISATAVDAGLRMLGLEQPGIERAVARIGPEWTSGSQGAPPWVHTALLAAGDRLRLEILAAAVSVTLSLPPAAATGPERLAAASQAFRPGVQRHADALSKALSAYYRKTKAARGKPMETDALVAAGAFDAAVLVDVWGHTMRAEWRPDSECCDHSFSLTSAGADGEFDTGDDVEAGASFTGWSTCRRTCGVGFGRAAFGTGLAGGGSYTTTAYGGVAVRSLEEPPMREWFPDTLAVLPEQVTDAQGHTTWSLPLADSLTRWLVQVRAVSLDGGLGEAELELPVEQPVSVDVAVEPELVLGDRITLPLELRNGTHEAADFELSATVEGAATLVDPVPATVRLAAGATQVLPLLLSANAVGEATVTLRAVGQAGGDRVRRSFQVVGGGVPTQQASAGAVAAGRTVTASVAAPEGAIPGTERIRVRLYGGALGAAVEGLESLLASPSGCFEQTSSTTYPNALVLDYLARTGLDRPETAIKARELLQAGWERLKGYEVAGGGFSWFGDAPANQVLTAFGLMEFAVMGRHMAIDKKLVARTREWLLAQRKDDGRWVPDAEYLHADSWQDIQSGALPVTAYITWSLVRSGEPLESLSRSLAYLEAHASEAEDSYTRAVVALALSAARSPGAEAAARRLASQLTREGGESPKAWLGGDAPTVTHAHGGVAGLETTGLASMAFLTVPGLSPDGEATVEWLLGQRHAGAGWGSTQATVLSLEALLERERLRAGHPTGEVTVSAEAQAPMTERFDAESAEVVRELTVPTTARPTVSLRFEGEGEVRFQLGAEAELPAARASSPEAPLTAALSMPTASRVGERFDAVLSLRAKRAVAMPLVTLELPAAVDVDLKALRGVKGLDRVEQVGRRLELYARRFEEGYAIDVPLALTARRVGTVHGGALLALPYYEPDRRHAEAGATLIVAP